MAAAEFVLMTLTSVESPPTIAVEVYIGRLLRTYSIHLARSSM